jgi:hypothetical protein
MQDQYTYTVSYLFCDINTLPLSCFPSGKRENKKQEDG